MFQKIKNVLNQQFLVGMASGVFLTAALLVIGGYLFFTLWLGHTDGGGMALGVPEFPTHPPLSSLKMFDYNGTVTRLDGRQIQLSDFRDKVLFLSFWATWCPPCKAEIPNIQNLYNTLNGEEGVRFLLVTNEDEEMVRRFLDQNRYSLPVYISGQALPAAFGVEGIPATFIINRRGDVVFRHTGAAKWDDPVCLEFIRGLI